ncbi:hypothetical protein DXG01_008777 [Tephrocybe rancida]|nr:hypothetical protein DXG01_008777 [Tephrocybe rancida]
MESQAQETIQYGPTNGHWFSYRTFRKQLPPLDDDATVIKIVLDSEARNNFSGIRVLVVGDWLRCGFEPGSYQRSTFFIGESTEEIPLRHRLQRHKRIRDFSRLNTHVFCTVTFELYRHPDLPTLGLRLLPHNTRIEGVPDGLCILQDVKYPFPTLYATFTTLGLRPDISHNVRILPLPVHLRRSSVAHDLPTDVLMQIVRYAIGRRDRGWRTDLIGYGSVCRAWAPTLDLYFESVQSRNCKDRPSSACVARALEQRPDRQPLLTMFLPTAYKDYYDNTRYAEFSQTCARILWSAPALKHMHLPVAATSAWEELVQAMQRLQGVTRCKLSTQLVHRPSAVVRPYSIDDVQTIVGGWKHLRTMHCERWTMQTPLESVLEQQYYLKELRLKEGFLTGPQLLRFVPLSSSSALKKLHLRSVSGLTNKNLHDLFCLVAPTLSELRIQNTHAPRATLDEPYALDATIASMPRLKNVTLEGDYMSALVIARKGPMPAKDETAGDQVRGTITLAVHTEFEVLHAQSVVAALETTGWKHVLVWWNRKMVWNADTPWDEERFAEMVPGIQARGVHLKLKFFDTSLMQGEDYTSDSLLIPAYVWYVVALDWATGKEVWRIRTGAGGTFNDDFRPRAPGLDGSFYQGVIGATMSEQPPPFQAVNSVKLTAGESSKIAAVSVYTERAEITRVFKFDVKTGQNQVTIDGLPDVFDEGSLRVEGRGSATIHDVSSYTHRPRVATTSSAISALELKKEKTSKALERCQKAIASLEAYLSTMDVKTVDVAQVRNVVKEYDTTAEELDDRVLELQAQLKEIDEELAKERTNLRGLAYNGRLNKRVVISVFADIEGEVEIVLIYAVHGASWTAGYDIRVDTNTRDEPVTLVYKAAITQNTGEDWTDIPLVLETATPTYGVGVPKLDPWNLSIYKPVPIPPPPPPMAMPMSVSGRMARKWAAPTSFSVSQSLDDAEDVESDRSIVHRGLDVASKGNVSATFQVPGLITIPSDGVAHNVTIVQLHLGATMSWVCVPKKDTKTHLSAKIKNASQYTLLRGTGSVYVDGSFISRSDVPAVSPEESFDCPLGLDPSIRVTYHPRAKKQSESGFYTKTTTHVFTQAITIHNTKSTPIERVRIAEQIPVSEDAQIQVKLVTPALVLREKDKDKDQGLEKPVAVSKGVSVLWEGADEPDLNAETLGRNGKFNWVCAVPPQGKINLVVQWEVVAPAQTTVLGLA